MSIFIYIVPGIVLLLPYWLLTGWIIKGLRIFPREIPDKKKAGTRFSILIPFRNEAVHLPALLESITHLDYPKDSFEILLIDDESTDESVETIQHFTANNNLKNIRLLSNNRSSISAKKDALNTGIKHARNPWIITTDADVIIPEDWLLTYHYHIDKYHPVMLFGGVRYRTKHTPIEQLQYWDWVGMQALTMAGFGHDRPVLGSAANMGFSKEAFYKVEGFQDNTDFAGGDDVFLLNKISKQFPGQIHFITTGEQISTMALSDFKSLCRQRVRWTKKSQAVPNPLMRNFAWRVLLTQIFFVGLGLLSGFEGQFIISWLLFWAGKGVADFLIINRALSLKQEKRAHSYMNMLLLIPIYSIFTLCVVGKTLLISRYKWKERSYTK